MTLFGITIVLRLPLKANAQYSMEVTLSGIVIEVSPQSEKAHCLMVVTLLGIVTEVRSEHPLNAS